VTYPRLFMLLALAAALPLVLAGCGTAEYHYVKNSEQKTYFKVPSDWRRIDQGALDNTLGGEDPNSAAARALAKLRWQVAYDAHTTPSPVHLYGAASDQPFVYAVIRPLTKEEQGAVSLDQLRNAFLPTTPDVRAQLERQGVATNFELTRDQVLTPGGGLRGVRTTFNYRLLPYSPVLQTFDVTAYASDKGRLYVMVVRCSARCFNERAEELNAIAQSFTVRND
jgi:hypothetical protein